MKPKKKFRTMLTILFMFCAGMVMAGENLLGNPSFSWNDNKLYWQGLSRCTTNYYTAPACFSIASETYWKACYQDVAVDAGKVYTASAWVQFVGSGSGSVEIRWLTASGTSAGSTGIVYPKTDVDWTYYENPKFMPPATAATARFYLAMAQNKVATIFVDDVVFEEWIDPATLVVIR